MRGPPTAPPAPAMQLQALRGRALAEPVAEPWAGLEGPRRPRSSSSPQRLLVHPVAPHVGAAGAAGTPVADASTITPALRAWIECLVDTRVEQASRSLRDNELAGLAAEAHSHGAAAAAQAAREATTEAARQVASATTEAALRRRDESRQQLENQVRGMAAAQARLMDIVEGLSGDRERTHASSSRARSEALGTVDRVVCSVDELQRTVEQDGDAARARLRELEAALEDLQRLQADEAARQRAATDELRRLQAEDFRRQQQCSEELAGTCSTIAATRQEVLDLVSGVQRLEARLGSWHADLADEVQSSCRALEKEIESHRVRLEGLQRDLASAVAARRDLESQVESLRAERRSGSQGPVPGPHWEPAHGLREAHAALAKRVDEYDSRVQVLQSACRDAQQALGRRIDSLQSAAMRDIEGARQELEELSEAVQQLGQRQDQRHDAVCLREESAAAVEGLRRELSQRCAGVESYLERQQRGLASVTASRDALEARMKENQETLRRSVDAWEERFRKAIDAREEALRDEVAALQQRASGEVVEACQSSLQGELAAVQKRLAAELRSEMRGLLKSEQSAIAALDEQLWRTDQRLGQRIDELAQASVHADGVARFAEPAAGPNGLGGAQKNDGAHQPRGALATASLAAQTFADMVGSEKQGGLRRSAPPEDGLGRSGSWGRISERS